MVECLALLGRVNEAREGFETLLGRAGPTGLFTEEFDPSTGSMVGNIPQAFSHVGLINAAWRLSEASADGTKQTDDK